VVAKASSKFNGSNRNEKKIADRWITRLVDR
jgi:hypothetical protein